MPISVACSACGDRLEAPDASVGGWAKCPSCGAFVIVRVDDRHPPATPAKAIPLPVAGRPALPAQAEPIDVEVIADGVPVAKAIRVADAIPEAKPIATPVAKAVPLPESKPVAIPEAKPSVPVAKVVDVPVANPVASPPPGGGARDSGRTGRPKSRFTVDRPVARKRHPTNRAVVATGIVAGLAAFGWLASVFGFAGWLTAQPPAALLTALALGSFFGGMCASSLTGVARFRHCFLAGVWAFVALLLVVTPFVFLLLWMNSRLEQAAALAASSDLAAGTDPEGIPISLPLVALLLALAPFLMIAGFLLGGGLDVLLTSAGRGMGSREKWTYHTRGGDSFPVYGPWRNAVLKVVWNGVGWVMLCTCWVPLLRQDVVGCLSAFALGHTGRRMAKKHGEASARDALENDRRPPIVYLRSFQDDGLFQPGTFYMVNDWLRTLSESTAEDTLATALAPFGPVVAIGRPEEEMPEVGAARIYVGDDHWQTLILDLITERGALAVFQAGVTKGLQWEMETVALKLQPEQVLLFLPFGLHRSRKRRDAGYAAFHAWADECSPAGLPERLSDGVFFLYFTATPQVKTCALKPDGLVPKGHPLGDVLKDLRASHALRPWRLMDLRRFFRFLLIALLLGLLSAGLKFVWQAVGGG